jgi:hypothetical protein
LHLDKSASAPLRVGENSEVGPWAANTATQHFEHDPDTCRSRPHQTEVLQISPGFAALAHAGHIQAEVIYDYAEALCQAAGTTMAKLLRAQYFVVRSTKHGLIRRDVDFSWDTIFAAVGPAFFKQASDDAINFNLRSLLSERIPHGDSFFVNASRFGNYKDTACRARFLGNI